jgi:hypothetical protein
MSGIFWWSVDPLEKVFPDATPPELREAPVRMIGARNEWVSGQAVLWSSERHLMRATLEASPLVPASSSEGPALRAPQVRYVGFVPVRENTRGTPADHLVRQAPGSFPDPLYEDEWLHLRRQRAQPVWITVHIPPDTPPGLYCGQIGVHARGNQRASIDVKLQVHEARLTDDRNLAVTNWFSLANICRSHGVDLFSEGFWEMLGRYAKIMAAHRQNTVITPLRQLIRPGVDERGEISLSFDLLDRWVELFDTYGVAQTIEGGHLGHRRGAWDGGFAVATWEARDGQVEVVDAEAGSAAADRFLAWFMPAVRRHVEARGWTDRYIQHLADEPVDANASSYDELLRSVRRYWPGLRLIDASASQAIEPLDIWVPVLNSWHRAYDFYCEQKEEGREVWFYTCLGPTGTYANRLIDYPTLKVRLLHWLNAHYGATGYLHWGLNYWDGLTSPFADVEPAHTPDLVLPPGDCGIVYPGPRGPLSSIRFEAMRDGIADYELLRELAAKDPAMAQRLTGAVIRDFNDYELDIAHFRKTRIRLLDAVAEVQGVR